MTELKPGDRVYIDWRDTVFSDMANHWPICYNLHKLDSHREVNYENLWLGLEDRGQPCKRCNYAQLPEAVLIKVIEQCLLTF